MNKKNKPLKNLKNTLLSRGFALSKMTLKASALSAKKNIALLWNAQPDNLKENTLIKQIELVTQELGELKGSIMKAGQQLSVYGQHFLPPEALEVLKTLQSNSTPVSWSIMEKTLLSELNEHTLQNLDIEHQPIASASLGQVYRARLKNENINVALKIQYPNLDKVIDADLKALKKLLKLLQFIPKSGKYDELFLEVKDMMKQELNYIHEGNSLMTIYNLLKQDPSYVVPYPYTETSTQKILIMNYEPSFRIDSAEIQNLTQNKRNEIASHFLKLYFRELFEFNFVQTDPHLGNYGVRLSKNQSPSLVLYDYGAVREIPPDFFKSYRKIIIGSITKNRPLLIDGAMTLGLIKDRDPKELVNRYIALCFMFTEPFWSPSENADSIPPTHFDELGNYDYRNSDLPQRIANAGKAIVLNFNFRIPPKELVFLDRKMGGTFSFLATLGANINGRKIFDEIFARHATIL
ncbi:MAG: AarF/ABC1/UbiB kinase family protein [Bdellovibrionaceae bacterium]|nr:AarF/ABC1/UbiB kinase family protein [Pseudobdellovibrionaceae bacterium]